MSRPALIVTGLGRCGSSLLMQMLAAGGVPCIGTFPAFEEDSFAPHRADPGRVSALSGRAVKILELHRLPPESFAAHLVIRLTRARAEQAKSMLKFIGVHANRRARAAMEAGIQHDEYQLGVALSRAAGLRTLGLTFEELVAYPARTAARVSQFIIPHGYPSIDRLEAVNVCIPRAPRCYPGLLEVRLMELASA